MKIARTNLNKLLELAKFSECVTDEMPAGAIAADTDGADVDTLSLAPMGDVGEDVGDVSTVTANKISGTAISLLIYAARFQDDEGNIHGLYYKEVANAIGCHPDYFYSALKSLEYHGLIAIDWINSLQGYWDIKILNNKFQSRADYKKGYVNINLEILQAKRFHLLACSDKVVVLHIVKNMHAFVKEYIDFGGGATGFDFSKMPISYSAIEKWAGVTRQTAKEIAKRLSKVINISFQPHQILVYLQGHENFGVKKDGADVAANSKEVDSLNISLVNRATDAAGQTEAEVRNVHLIRHVLRLMSINPDDQNSHLISKMALVLKTRAVKCIYHIYDAVAQVFWDIGRISPRRLNYIISSHYR